MFPGHRSPALLLLAFVAGCAGAGEGVADPGASPPDAFEPTDGAMHDVSLPDAADRDLDALEVEEVADDARGDIPDDLRSPDGADADEDATGDAGDVPFDPGPWPEAPAGWSRHGTYLLDPQGRVALLHGANVSNYAKYAPGYLTWHDRAAFDDLAAIGLDSVRLLTFWAAVMPEDGVVDTDYLDAYVARIDAANAAGLDVVVDMHQDVFGVGFGEDGAPRWACDESRYASYVPQQPWYLNYLSDEVRACFDDFYGDSERFGKFVDAWVALAERVKDHPGVVGFDLLNEPNWGNFPVDRFLPDLWLPLQEQLADALAEVAPEKMVFVEGGTLYLTMGVPEPARATRLERVAFAPHFYHMSVHDGGSYERDTMFDAIDAALSSMRGTADVLGHVPVWVGEFGGPWSVPGFDAYMTDLFTGMASRGFGWAVYCDDRSGEDGFGIRDEAGAIRPAAAALLGHPKVRRVPGPIREQVLADDLSTHRVAFAWEADAPVELWVPEPAEGAAAAPVVHRIEPAGAEASCEHPDGTPDGVWTCPRPADASGVWEVVAGS